HCPVMSVITYVCFWVSAHSLKSLASFEAFPGLQTNMSWTMIIMSILPTRVRGLKPRFGTPNETQSAREKVMGTQRELPGGTRKVGRNGTVPASTAGCCEQHTNKGWPHDDSSWSSGAICDAGPKARRDCVYLLSGIGLLFHKHVQPFVVDFTRGGEAVHIPVRRWHH